MGAMLGHTVSGFGRHGVCPQSSSQICPHENLMSQVNRAINHRHGDLRRTATGHLVQLAQTFKQVQVGSRAAIGGH
ncbi:unannotated protein [freshwater metagenome]|uniref:Unannotated protein n=1 Tax=freshwater metagenome TaxID=449393 RepID=A0A6J6LT40_9ZZZZ